MKVKLIIVLLLVLSTPIYGQGFTVIADSIRIANHIPELAYAVVSSDSVYAMQNLGFRKDKSNLGARAEDRFRIGSNTKSITGFIAAELVKQHKISWDTKFFDLFPEMKQQSNKAYYELTLLDLLSFRTRLIKYTYTDAVPVAGQFTGNEDEQRYQFAAWVITQKPVSAKGGISFSNPGYVLAGLMLEQASGKKYKQLVKELGDRIGIEFGFGAPNTKDSLQTWGHGAECRPEPPAVNNKLEWLLAAGNINVTLNDYVKFIRLLLQGLKGESTMLTKEEFNFLFSCREKFSVGWFSEVDEEGHPFFFHAGNPGTFLSKVYVFKDSNMAYIILANVQNDDAERGMDALYQLLRDKY